MAETAVPRGTHPGVEPVNWQADLAAREADAAGGDAYFDRLRADRIASLNRRSLAAGLAHIDRLAVDGGPLTGSRERHHPSLWQAIGAFALAGLILATLYGAFVLAWAGE